MAKTKTKTSAKSADVSAGEKSILEFQKITEDAIRAQTKGAALAKRKNPPKDDVIKYLETRLTDAPFQMPAPRGYHPNSEESHPGLAPMEVLAQFMEAVERYKQGQAIGAFEAVFLAGCRWGEFTMWKEAVEGRDYRARLDGKRLQDQVTAWKRRKKVAEKYRAAKAKNPRKSASEIANKICKEQTSQSLHDDEAVTWTARTIRDDIGKIIKWGWIK